MQEPRDGFPRMHHLASRENDRIFAEDSAEYFEMHTAQVFFRSVGDKKIKISTELKKTTTNEQFPQIVFHKIAP